MRSKKYRVVERGVQDIEQRSFDFAVRVLRMVDQFPRTVAAFELGKQVVRSAMSVNSNVVQARAGVSRADFRNHMRIALKEAKETMRWIEMAVAGGLVSESRVRVLLHENDEIIRVIHAIAKNTK